MQVAAQRMAHHGVPIEHARSDLAGYPLGRMWQTGKITERLHDVGKAWAELRWRYWRIEGLMSPMSRCIDWQGPGGRSLAHPPAPEEVASVKRNMGNAFEAAWLYVDVLDHVCVADNEPDNWLVFYEGLQALDKARDWR